MSDLRKLVIAGVCAVCVLILAFPAGSAEPAVIEQDVVVMEQVTAPPDCPGESWRAIRLHCKQGWTGAAIGIYGWTNFAVFCDGNRVTTTICTEHGNHDWEVAMSASDGSLIVDCFFSGQSPGINETCGNVHLTVN